MKNSCSNVKPFPIMCNLRHALPRIFIRVWGVRNSCTKATQKARKFPQSRTSHRHSMINPRPWTSCEQVLSVSTIIPRSRSFHGNSTATATVMASPQTGNVHGHGQSTDSPRTWFVHDHDQSTSMGCPQFTIGHRMSTHFHSIATSLTDLVQNIAI